MNVLTKPRMTVDEFLTWAEDRAGRYELFRGEVYKMSPEAVGHSATKGAVYIALLASVRRANISCYVLPDGPTVRIDSETAYEPDALVYCGEKVSTRALEIPNPMIVFEVLSPSTQRIDVVRKLADYFRVPTVAPSRRAALTTRSPKVMQPRARPAALAIGVQVSSRIASRSSTLNNGVFPGWVPIASTSRSASRAVWRTRSRWPLVTGSNDPGKSAVRGMAAGLAREFRDRKAGLPLPAAPPSPPLRQRAPANPP
jgi:hypothetical protein